MSTHLRIITIAIAAVFSTSFCANLNAQEEEARRPEPPSGQAGAAASPAATTPPLTSAVTPPPAPASAQQLTDVLFKSLKARAIGPAVMGGRVSDIAIDPGNPFVVGRAGRSALEGVSRTFEQQFNRVDERSVEVEQDCDRSSRFHRDGSANATM